MDAFAAEVTATDIAEMPLLEHEWGDQWLGGLQTDPWRIQVYREIVRLREACIGSGECAVNSTALRNMTRWLAKISEHTQGVQSESWSPGTAPNKSTKYIGHSHPIHKRAACMFLKIFDINIK